ncbi:hypothetical protein UQ64_11250 [Paenibacillus etheri]|uniref:Photosynthesis system II assembly factor Ycf48/Hcf136-like domain-containing protein n=1 Tax=Paenibacillus etheri TaxID=1306852 RepID=A0A0W1B1C0_9BACL|nr:hypothetical protein UQ64_11250 [Paenibacillus etheri]
MVRNIAFIKDAKEFREYTMNLFKRVVPRNITLIVLILLLITGTFITAVPSAKALEVGNQDANTGVKVQKIVASNLQSYALDTQGNLWAWGQYNNFGEIGNAVPQEVSFFKDKPIKDIQGGNQFLQVLLKDGTVWGRFNYSKDTASFSQIKGLKQIVQISDAAAYVYATQSDGTVWLYVPSEPGKAAVKRPELSNAGFKAFFDTYAIKNDGTVWSIGNKSSVPIQVEGLSGIKKIIDGQTNQPNYALSEEGQVWGWGVSTIYTSSPNTGVINLKLLQGEEGAVERIEGLEGIQDITSGENFYTVLKEDRTVWAWGFNDRNQLGDGTTKYSVQPVKVSNLNNAVGLSNGCMAAHSFALLADGSAVTWGDNSKQQSGTGSDQKTIPTPQEVAFSALTGDAEKQFTFTFDGVKGNELGQAASNGKGLVIIPKLTGLLVSKDGGATWSTRPLPINSSKISITYQHDRFFLSDQNLSLPHLYYSLDGEKWIETAVELQSSVLKAHTITWQNNQFILLSYPDQTMKTEVYTSTDGSMWNLQGTVGERLDQIYWNGKRYLMTYGGYAYYGSASTRNQFLYIPSDKRNVELIVYTSDNLSQWTQQSGKVNNNLKYKATINGKPIRNYWLTFDELQSDGTLVFYDTEGNNLSTKDGINFKLVRTSDMFSGLYSRSEIFWNGKQYLIYATRFREEGIVFVSTDKVNWQQQKIPNMPLGMMVTYTGKYFVGYSGTRLAVSKDGLKWDLKQSGKPDASFNQVVKGNGTYVAVGSLYTYAVPTVATSKDGKNWQQILLGNREDTTVNGLTSVAWNGNVFVAVGLQYAWTSKDGIAWNRNNKPLDAEMKHVIWTGKHYVAIGHAKGNDKKSMIYSSENGTTWKKVYDWSGKLTDIATHNGTTVVVGTNGSKAIVVQSTNLTKWNLQTFTLGNDLPNWKQQQNDYEEAYTFLNVQWAKDKFIIVSDHIYSSTNGLQWTAVKGQYDEYIKTHAASSNASRLVWTGIDYRFISSNRIGVSKDLKSWDFYEHNEFYNFNEMLWTGTDMLVTGAGGLLVHLREN